MANVGRIRLRRGLEAQLPTLAPGEPGFCLDTYRLFIGSPAGNQPLDISGALLIVNDLSDLDDVATARANLGLGDLAVLDNVDGGSL